MTDAQLQNAITITGITRGQSSFSGKDADELFVCVMDGRTLLLTKQEVLKFAHMRFGCQPAEGQPRPATMLGNGG